jgi:hypothetical protein
MNDPANTTIETVLSEPEKFNSDREYLDAMCEHFGCELSRDLIALTIATHTDLDNFSDWEWERFTVIFGGLIAQFIASEEWGYGRPN